MMLDILTEIWSFLLIVSPWLILGLFIAGLIHSFIGDDFIREHLGGNGFSSIIKATLFGIPLPVCSCSVIPIAAGLRKDGASKAATMSFLVSTPTTGIDSIFVTYAFLGGAFTIARPLAALFSGLLIGLLIYFFEKEQSVISKITHSHNSQLSIKTRIKSTFFYGFRVLPQDLSSTLLIGIVIGGALSALLPVDFAQQYLTNPYIAYPLMLLISVPMYVCAVGSVPIAAALLMKGLLPGAALAFLIAGTVTNTITLSFVGKTLGKKVLSLYLISILSVAVIFGLVMDLALPEFQLNNVMHHKEHLPDFLRYGATVILLIILLPNLIKFKKKVKMMDHIFHVPDMTCKHCRMKIEQSLEQIAGIEKLEISVDDKTVKINGDIDRNSVIDTIKSAGYTIEEEVDI